MCSIDDVVYGFHSKWCKYYIAYSCFSDIKSKRTKEAIHDQRVMKQFDKSLEYSTTPQPEKTLYQRKGENVKKKLVLDFLEEYSQPLPSARTVKKKDLVQKHVLQFSLWRQPLPGMFDGFKIAYSNWFKYLFCSGCVIWYLFSFYQNVYYTCLAFLLLLNLIDPLTAV